MGVFEDCVHHQIAIWIRTTRIDQKIYVLCSGVQQISCFPLFMPLLLLGTLVFLASTSQPHCQILLARAVSSCGFCAFSITQSHPYLPSLPTWVSCQGHSFPPKSELQPATSIVSRSSPSDGAPDQLNLKIWIQSLRTTVALLCCTSQSKAQYILLIFQIYLHAYTRPSHLRCTCSVRNKSSVSPVTPTFVWSHVLQHEFCSSLA